MIPGLFPLGPGRFACGEDPSAVRDIGKSEGFREAAGLEARDMRTIELNVAFLLEVLIGPDDHSLVLQVVGFPFGEFRFDLSADQKHSAFSHESEQGQVEDFLHWFGSLIEPTVLAGPSDNPAALFLDDQFESVGLVFFPLGGNRFESDRQAIGRGDDLGADQAVLIVAQRLVH